MVIEWTRMSPNLMYKNKADQSFTLVNKSIQLNADRPSVAELTYFVRQNFFASAISCDSARREWFTFWPTFLAVMFVQVITEVTGLVFLKKGF